MAGSALGLYGGSPQSGSTAVSGAAADMKVFGGGADGGVGDYTPRWSSLRDTLDSMGEDSGDGLSIRRGDQTMGGLSGDEDAPTSDDLEVSCSNVHHRAFFLF